MNMNWNCTRINEDGSSCYGSMNNDGTCYPCDSEVDDPASVGGGGRFPRGLRPSLGGGRGRAHVVPTSSPNPHYDNRARKQRGRRLRALKRRGWGGVPIPYPTYPTPQMKMGTACGSCSDDSCKKKGGLCINCSAGGQVCMGSGAMGRSPSGYANFTMPVFKQPIVPALVMGMVIGVGLFASYQLTRTLNV